MSDVLKEANCSSPGITPSTRHCVIYGVESWSGVLEWSHGVEFLSGLWSGMESDFEFLAPF